MALFSDMIKQLEHDAKLQQIELDEAVQRGCGPGAPQRKIESLRSTLQRTQQRLEILRPLQAAHDANALTKRTRRVALPMYPGFKSSEAHDRRR